MIFENGSISTGTLGMGIKLEMQLKKAPRREPYESIPHPHLLQSNPVSSGLGLIRIAEPGRNEALI